MSKLSRVIYDIDATAPSVPTGVSASAQSQTTIRITWSASTDTGGSGLAGYRVFRSTSSGGSYSQIAELTTASLAYDDSPLTSGTTYYYRVAAFDGNGNQSTLSSITSATTQAGGATFDFYVSPTGTGSASTGGTSPETAWAITTLNDSVAKARYGGRRVGILPGTYNIGLLGASGGHADSPKLNIAPGSAGNQTVIESTVPQAAIITGAGGSNFVPSIGSKETNTGYITLKGLVIEHHRKHSVLFARVGNSNSNQGPGIRIDSCIIRNQTYGGQNDLAPGIFLAGLDAAEVVNCWLYNITSQTQASNAAGIETYGCRHNVYDRTTFGPNVYYPIYDKYGAGNVEMQGTIIRQCYFTGGVVAMLGFDNRIQSGPAGDEGPYPPYHIYNNIVEDCGATLESLGGFVADAPVYFYNNTLYKSSGEFSGPILQSLRTSGTTPRFYNNIVYHPSNQWGGGWRAVTLTRVGSNPAVAEVLNYNCYGPSASVWQYYTAYGDPYTNGGSYQLVTSLASWRTTTGAEGASMVANPSFAMSGSGAARFQLQAGSPCLSAGRRGGTSAGAICNIGAWDGSVTQIGHSF